MPRIHFIAMITIMFLGGYTNNNAMAVGLRGHNNNGNDDDLGEADDYYESGCPLDTPAMGSHCESSSYGEEDDDEGTPDLCYFNFVKTPGPSPEEDNFVPSIACSCNDGRWQCNVAPEYLQALTEATFGLH
ncbi:hypothetical protein IV203_017378 [Nitzschia inconspicua]|uniref:Uncharacterized protein n=1 Tax=Nitzschia inconspicua TaxID=303405 RepID=A0A9K3PII7_9STRA|nr:hypothetical protein IV203_017565 [Nitzschia inconspicua]KAG7348673.1 hypothetical protein IV203_017378 [Nitzschia inconspicua]